MSTEFRPGTPGDLDEIANLMQAAFGAKPDAPFLDRRLLQWKYFEPGPAWDGSRSYVLRQNGALMAHGCAWPVPIAYQGATRSGICLIDWAGSKSSPGAGLQIVRKLGAMADVLISIGGSAATQQIMPRIGFRTVTQQNLFARVLRPWRQFRTRPEPPSPRGIARFARNLGYSRARRAATEGWSAQPVDVIAGELPVTAAGPASIHSQAFLSYMKNCPAAQIRLYSLLKGGQPAGYFVFASVAGQTRIAELRIESSDSADWAAAVSQAVTTALELPEACELACSASAPPLQQALEANGFRQRGTHSIFVQDPKKLLPQEGAAWDLSMLDDDSPFMNSPDYPYWT